MAIKVNDLADKIIKELTTWSTQMVEQVNAEGAALAKEGLMLIKAESPERTKAYGKSWRIEVKKGPHGGFTKYTLYNKEHYRLTHLLEKGHATSKGTRTRPIQHIGPTEKHLNEAYEGMVRRVIRGGRNS